eukprot:gene6135-10143_t
MQQVRKKLVSNSKRFYITSANMSILELHQKSQKNVESLKDYKTKLYKEPEEGDYVIETPSWKKKTNLKYTPAQGIEVYKKLNFSEEETNKVKSIENSEENIFEKWDIFKTKMEEKMFKMMKEEFSVQEQSRDELTKFKYQLGKLSVEKDIPEDYKEERKRFYSEISSKFFSIEKNEKFILPIQTATSYATVSLLRAFEKDPKEIPDSKLRFEEEMKLLKEFDEKNKTEFKHGSLEGWILYKCLIEEQYYQC